MVYVVHNGHDTIKTGQISGQFPEFRTYLSILTTEHLGLWRSLLFQKERTMQSPDGKVDMAQMNAAIDKDLALPATIQAEVKERRRIQRKAECPSPARSSKNVSRVAVR